MLRTFCARGSTSTDKKTSKARASSRMLRVIWKKTSKRDNKRILSYQTDYYCTSYIHI